MGVEVPPVLLPQPPGVHRQLVPLHLQAAELRRVLEREVEFFGRQDLEQDDIVPTVPQVPQRPRDARDVAEAVRKEDHQPAALQVLAGDLVPHVAQARLPADGRLLQRPQQCEQVFAGRLRRDELPRLAVVRQQPDRVELPEQQVRQAGGHLLGEPELAQRLLPLVGHAPARVHHQHRLQVRLVLVLLDEVAVGLAERPPVDAADLVAGVVLAVLGELQAEPFKRAAVDARQKSLHHVPRDQRQAAVPGQFGRVEQLTTLAHVAPAGWGAGRTTNDSPAAARANPHATSPHTG